MRALLFATAALALSGCGYRFAAGGSAVLPRGITQVRAPVFSNETAEPSLEVSFSRALREQLMRSGIDTNASAGAEIQGRITSVWGSPTVLTTPASAAESPRLASYRIFVTARVKLLQGGQTLAETEVSGAEDYLPGVDVLQTEANRQAALERLAHKLMRDAFERLSTTG